MQEGPAAGGLFGDNVREGGRGSGRGTEVAGVDFMASAVLPDLPAGVVIADEAGAQERKRCAAAGEDGEDIVGAAARAVDPAEDVAELPGLRVEVDDMDVVQEPVAAASRPRRVLEAVFGAMRALQRPE